ncbi:peptidoglycan DD-metalloendopeptidase family protein [Paenibacillus sp. N3.4]|uniref:peptidoglycan DD-metalloendopeptidase family protein n=1 Tax=Paenibacillus sp. N3.4 TaxID=2603222 RepID=UPI0011C84ACD|nr:peptidoglycan DD-metalloendopeptidase family protein [Paenibacillus sp. N3.4]TXK76358.1 peptidoglycan DD-metalloendopeptidase family protein [Paenibacillus sp. N3.4]
MKLKWKPKKLTLVIIPDANQSVVRFRIPNIFAYIAAACLSLLLLISMITYALHAHTLKTASELQSKLNGVNHQWNATLSSKNQAIEKLQNEVIQLSQQAEQMKTQVEEMKKFENDLKSIAGIEASPSVATSIGVQDGPTDGTAPVTLNAAGIGGSPNPVSQEAIIQLGEQTLASFTLLHSEVQELQTSLAETKEKVTVKQQLLRVTPTLWPTSTKVVTSTFGYRTDPFTHRPSFHSGIDFGAKENDPVFATAAGKVVSTGKDMFHGNNIVIEHSKGLRTWYMHLNKILVNNGDTVEKGSTIGLVGSTGRSTGAHLHYEVLKNGESTDPKPYLKAMRKDE